MKQITKNRNRRLTAAEKKTVAAAGFVPEKFLYSGEEEVLYSGEKKRYLILVEKSTGETFYAAKNPEN